MYRKFLIVFSVILAALTLTACSQTAGNDNSEHVSEESKAGSYSSTIKETDDSSEQAESSEKKQSSVADESSGSGDDSGSEGSSEPEEKSKPEESSEPEDKSEPEDNADKEESSETGKNDKTKKTAKAVSLIDDSVGIPARIDYYNGANTMSVKNKNAIQTAFSELGKMKLGEETDEKYGVPDKTVSFYNKKGKKTFVLNFDGDYLEKNGRNYEIIDGENLTRIFNLFLVYKVREKSISGGSIEEPTPPYFRPYSDEDPYHIIPQHIIDPDEDELAEDTDKGKKYAMNELIVVIDESYSSVMIDLAAEDVGAQIVASHDETNRYQFRFGYDMSKQELEETADMLKNNYGYIADAYLHYV